MKKRVFYTELAYLLGILLCAVGVALMALADFGVSVIVAPAYLIFRHVSETLPFFTFGMAEYTLQACLLIALCLILRRFRWAYLFSFVTAVFYGLLLDLSTVLVASLPCTTILQRLLLYAVGMVLCSVGVSFMVHTYISPEVYELFVKSIAEKFGKPIPRVKIVYDCASCVVGVLLSFLFFGLWHFEGVKIWTVICALLNSWLIGQSSRWFEQRFTFRDAFPWRPFFEGEQEKTAA